MAKPYAHDAEPAGAVKTAPVWWLPVKRFTFLAKVIAIARGTHSRAVAWHCALLAAAIGALQFHLSRHIWEPMESPMPPIMIALNRGVHDRQKLEEYWKAASPDI